MGVNVEYRHYFPKVRPSSEYPSKFSFHLIKTLAQLEKSIESWPETIAFDTENTSLNHEEAEPVGFSFATDLSEAFYVPVGHVNNNIDDVQGAKLLLKSVLKGRRLLFYNKRYDLRILERCYGVDTSQFSHFDIQLLVWLMDTNISMPSLKWAEDHFLGWSAVTYEDLVGSRSIALLDPEEVTTYAATDALGTLHLARKLSPFSKDFRFIYLLDNRALDVVKKVEETLIRVDRPYLESLIPLFDYEIQRLRELVYQLSGRYFVIDSPAQCSQVLVENGCSSGELTTQNKVSTSKKALARVKHPLVQAILEYRTVSRNKASYVEKILVESQKKGGGVRCNHLTFRVPTGRYATGRDVKNTYFSAFNIMSVPKPRSANYKAFQDDDSPTGWRFEPDSHGPVESYSMEMNIRRAFVPPPGYTWVSIDYKAQELRIPALYSKEPIWVKAFIEGKDIHNEVSREIWGPDFTKDDRKKTKILNFSLLYEGTPYSVSRAMNVDEETAAKYIAKYKQKHKTLYRWKAFVVRRAKMRGYVKTFYGRPRRLKHYFQSSDFRIVKFGARSAINSPVQGMGADLIKIAVVRVDENVKPIYGEALLYQQLVHDEANYCVRNDLLLEIVPKLVDEMTVQEDGWPFPMMVDLSMGDSWGSIFPYSLIDGRFVPQGVELQYEHSGEDLEFVAEDK